MSDDLMPDPESLRYLDRLRRNPDLWTVAVVRSSTPLAEHGDPDACPCLAHHAARLVHARPDPALDPDQPGGTHPRTAKTKPGQRRKPPATPKPEPSSDRRVRVSPVESPSSRAPFR